ncbi:MAG: phosphoribosyltransferase [Saprospiraceae bacterium]|nr:phosphoribosyltransferase [Saprospiraceae bacterium]
MEIYERHSNDSEIIIIGIKDQGALFADQLCQEIHKLSPLKCTQAQMSLNKVKPTSADVQSNIELSTLKNKSVLLVDDVANSGKTMFYALGGLMKATPKSIETVVLVERLHKRFPVEVTFVGMKLATTIKEHIEVKLNGQNDWTVELK